ncbi:MAG: histidine--tRNA ligase [Bdellovibrionales bacterium RIFCSPHIGHO2_01_FULL_40_29]|nr:MAG: histidine--tRNA ligase [Bdellovibrionales bacterium RIFCSPHIGHO2_01_FULL_40_29]OFZ33402.1 MAG: histidine--tRNA ligase [Bdellovibrionales bacterium RIFCSPHIGHO2_02_FULL_40_15]
MSKYQSVRGTRDLLPALKKVFRQIDEIAYKTARNYGFNEIETPIFEFSDVFHRSLGETSDAVSKETYTFTDRGGDSITLRPEGTAGVVRSFVSEGLAQHLPLKLYYYGPMFRYERPQKGRYRQFYQFGVEMLGLETPLADIECLDLAWTIIKKLNLSERCILEINTLGDTESRADYRKALIDFLTPLKFQLSPDSQVRLEKNPMRILDSKDEGDRKLLADAPLMENFLNEKSKDFFTKVIAGLKHLNIPFKLNPKLVRGLDYYCHTVFEFTTTELGAQGAILSGGRYDGLVEMLGGPKTAGVGWAAGVDRLADLCEKSLPASTEDILFGFAAIGPNAELEALQLASALTAKNKKCISFHTGNLKKKLEKISKLTNDAENVYAILLFDQNDGSIEYKIKNFKTGEEKTATKQDILSL